MPFTIVRNDITAMQVDVIVNAANTSLQQGGGVCGAIFAAAGAGELQRECDAIGGCEVGQAVLTKGYRLPAPYIIHTPGPVWRGGGQGEASLLRDCYRNSLLLAERHGCESIAFPLISSGIFGYPKQEALQAATEAIRSFLLGSDLDVYLVVFDWGAVEVGEQLLGGVEAFIDEHYVRQHASLRRSKLPVERQALQEDALLPPQSAPEPDIPHLDEWIGRLDASFSQQLLRLIDRKGRTDVDVYKRANLDRKLFSKIRSNASYVPSKRTAVALAIALELDLEEAQDLLERAGYALSRSQKFDVIIEYFIGRGKYDLFEINEVLFHYGQPSLGPG
ncbi:macro domain-containing protein [Cohnella fermenti]|uniref:RNase III inhibitor n=1 Tax=Cohnella fermenti TaxID=2565925 RepID=A0A4S4CER5_9BACL|nr:macro domain-containing protein [Cohnella fermenti]THF84505.1 RNase III inhibitor [Cohnella fermenti]